MSATTRHGDGRKKRPWYASNRAIDEYRTTLTTDGQNLPMLKTLKIARSIIVNLGIIVLTGYALSLGADATLITGLALATLAGYNGIEITDYFALIQAYQEVQQDGGESGNGNENNNE